MTWRRPDRVFADVAIVSAPVLLCGRPASASADTRIHLLAVVAADACVEASVGTVWHLLVTFTLAPCGTHIVKKQQQQHFCHDFTGKYF